MRLSLTEEQSLVEASVRSLLEGEYSFAQRQHSLDAPNGCRAELWTQFAHMGWLALPVPQDAGGLGGGALETGLLTRAFGRHLVVEPYLACAVLVGGVVSRMARPDQVEAWLPGLMEGRLRMALAHEEAGQRNPFAPARMSATRKGGQWELRGTKPLARGESGADALLVTATEATSAATPERERVFLVRPGATGLSIQAARCADGAHAADLRLAGSALEPHHEPAAGRR